jgi:hypothetical protein
MKDQTKISLIRRNPSEPLEGTCHKGGVTKNIRSSFIDVDGEEIQIVDRTSCCAAADSVEALLTSIIKVSIVELGGCHPCNYTPDYVEALQPDLCEAVGMTRVKELCRELHGAEDPGLSDWYRARFYQLNKEFFDGCLEDYDVRVVYDVFPWIGVRRDKIILGHTNLAQRRIVLGMPYDLNAHQMDALLIHHMAHANTKTTCDDSRAWRWEMKRLDEADADVFAQDLGPGEGCGLRNEMDDRRLSSPAVLRELLLRMFLRPAGTRFSDSPSLVRSLEVP